eukprot:sb/3461320/
MAIKFGFKPRERVESSSSRKTRKIKFGFRPKTAKPESEEVQALDVSSAPVGDPAVDGTVPVGFPKSRKSRKVKFGFKPKAAKPSVALPEEEDPDVPVLVGNVSSAPVSAPVLNVGVTVPVDLGKKQKKGYKRRNKKGKPEAEEDIKFSTIEANVRVESTEPKRTKSFGQRFRASFRRSKKPAVSESKSVDGNLSSKESSPEIVDVAVTVKHAPEEVVFPKQSHDQEEQTKNEGFKFGFSSKSKNKEPEKSVSPSIDHKDDGKNPQLKKDKKLKDSKEPEPVVNEEIPPKKTKKKKNKQKEENHDESLEIPAVVVDVQLQKGEKIESKPDVNKPDRPPPPTANLTIDVEEEDSKAAKKARKEERKKKRMEKQAKKEGSGVEVNIEPLKPERPPPTYEVEEPKPIAAELKNKKKKKVKESTPEPTRPTSNPPVTVESSKPLGSKKKKKDKENEPEQPIRPSSKPPKMVLEVQVDKTAVPKTPEPVRPKTKPPAKGDSLVASNIPSIKTPEPTRPKGKPPKKGSLSVTEKSMDKTAVPKTPEPVRPNTKPPAKGDSLDASSIPTIKTPEPNRPKGKPPKKGALSVTEKSADKTAVPKTPEPVRPNTKPPAKDDSLDASSIPAIKTPEPTRPKGKPPKKGSLSVTEKSEEEASKMKAASVSPSPQRPETLPPNPKKTKKQKKNKETVEEPKRPATKPPQIENSLIIGSDIPLPTTPEPVRPKTKPPGSIKKKNEVEIVADISAPSRPIDGPPTDAKRKSKKEKQITDEAENPVRPASKPPGSIETSKGEQAEVEIVGAVNTAPSRPEIGPPGAKRKSKKKKQSAEEIVEPVRPKTKPPGSVEKKMESAGSDVEVVLAVKVAAPSRPEEGPLLKAKKKSKKEAMIKTPEPVRPMSKPPGSIKKPSDATLIVKPVTVPLTPEPIRPKTKPPSFKKAPSQLDNIQPVDVKPISPVKPPERPEPARPTSKPPKGRSSLSLRRGDPEISPTRPAGLSSRSKSFSASSTPSPTDDSSPTKRPPVPPRPSVVQVSSQPLQISSQPMQISSQPLQISSQPPEQSKKKKNWLRRVSVAAIGGNNEKSSESEISPTNDPFPTGAALQQVANVCTTPTQERRFILEAPSTSPNLNTRKVKQHSITPGEEING